MRFPGYPNNREADEGAQRRRDTREDAPEDEAKPGDLFTHTTWGLGRYNYVFF